MAKHIEPTGLLIFDGECGFCRRWIRYMRSWFRTLPEAVAWQESDLVSLGLTEEQCRAAVQFVDAGGRVWSGSDAAAQVLKVAGFPFSLLGRVMLLPLVRVIPRRMYKWVARNRHRFHGDPK